MKKLLSLTLLMLLGATTMFAQHKMEPNKQRASPHETVKGNHMTVTYGRPYKKGRDIFGGLEAYGKVWRVGADEATEITFDKDGTFAGKPVKAGTYTLFTIPEKDHWTIILNSQLQQWGAFGYDKVKSKDVLTATVPVANHDNVTEQFTIATSESGLTLDWDHTMIKIPAQF